MYQSSKTTREKYTYQINAFNVWLDKNKISEEYVTKDDAEKYLLEEIIFLGNVNKIRYCD